MFTMSDDSGAQLLPGTFPFTVAHLPSESRTQKVDVGSNPCDTSRERADVRDQDPGDRAGDRGFEVFGETAAAAKLCERPSDHPAAGQNLKTLTSERLMISSVHAPLPFNAARSSSPA